MPDGGNLTLRLERTRHAPSLAREALREYGSEWRAETLHDAMLIVSELVTNAVLHGNGVITVVVHRTLGSVSITVGDESDAGLMMLERSLDSDSGRGLAVIDAVAHAWGVRHSDHRAGKSVWCRL